MQPTASWGSQWIPLSLAYVASYLRENGNCIELVDCQATEINSDCLTNQIVCFKPDLIVISTGFPSIKGDVHAVEKIRNSIPEVKIAVIGMYPTLLGKRCLDEYPNIDFAVIGEPEWVVCKLADSIEKVKPLSEIKGLAYRNGNELVVNQPQNYLDNDINALPFPARDLLENDSYRLAGSNDKFTHINIARGCPYKCEFCTASEYNGKSFRKRNIESIISEIDECITRYDIRNFVFWFEEYSFDHTFAVGLCDAIIQKKYQINWFARSRVDNLTLRLLQKMKESGCKGLSLGIESSSQHILDNVQKEITVEQITDAIRIAKQIGISTTGHFIFGLPGETQETADETIRFAKNSGLDFAQFYCAVPYPNTPFGDLAKKNDWIRTEDYSKYHFTESVSRNECLSPEEITAIRSQAYKSFYMTPKFLWKAVKLSANHKSVRPLIDFARWSKP